MSLVTTAPGPAHLFDLDREQLRQLLAENALPAFRADQVLEWVFRKHISDAQRMSNISKPHREALGRLLTIEAGAVLQHQVASDGVQKLLVDWPISAAPSGEAAAAAPALLPMLAPAAPPSWGQSECVMIPATGRKTACISSQVGCPVGCRFCASGLGGLENNLTAGRIVEQVWRLGTLPEVGRITHVVFMGMGEPLANFEQVTRAIATMMAPWGLGISGRRITLSTVGLPAQMRRLAELELPITLAISLHAPNDEIRRQLIPWAEHVTIEQLVAAGQYFFARTGREVTLEYTLLRGVNDLDAHAHELARVARELRSNVNLIRYNEVAGLPFGRPLDQQVLSFQQILREHGVNVHIRASRGRDIAAACGQLRHEQPGMAAADPKKNQPEVGPLAGNLEI